MIYLMKDEKRNVCLFKVGYTKNIDTRMIPYITHNPMAELVDAMVTYRKTKCELETAVHEELKSWGIDRVEGMDGTVTEWFAVDYDSPLYNALTEQGLKAFKACGHRKSLMKD